METWHFLVMVVVVNSAIWTYFDASRQRDAFHIGVGPDGRPPHLWASWVLLVWPVGLALYIRARGTAQLAEPRPGPPPRFLIGGFNFFAISVGLIGLGIFVTLIVFGRFRLATLGLVIAAAGLFGGRRASVAGEGETDFGLGELGIEQVGFRAGSEEHGADDKEIANVEAYFANLAAPNLSPPGAPANAARPVTEGNASPPPLLQPASTGPFMPAPAPAPASAPSPPPLATAAPSPSPTKGQGGARDPSPGVVYSPPPVGVVYAPPAPGAAPPSPSPPTAPPRPADSRATVALSEAAVTAELRGRAPAAPVGPGAAPRPATPPVSARPAPVRATSELPVPVVHAPLVPPPPRPKKPSAAGRGSAYAAAGKARKSSPWPWVAVLVVALGGLGTAGYFFLDPVLWTGADDEPIVEVAAPAETEAAEEESPEPIPELEEEIEEGVADREEMEAWLEDYGTAMGALAGVLDEVDFDGFDDGTCQSLRRELKKVQRKLGPAPDAEIDRLVDAGLAAFSQGIEACRQADEPGWALALLNGKASTHEAQQLMDRRYLYRGILELELESETGTERSEESISGRFLASSLP